MCWMQCFLSCASCCHKCATKDEPVEPTYQEEPSFVPEEDPGPDVVGYDAAENEAVENDVAHAENQQ